MTNTARNLNIIDDNIPPEREFEIKKSRFIILVILFTASAKLYYGTIITHKFPFVNICKVNYKTVR